MHSTKDGRWKSKTRTYERRTAPPTQKEQRTNNSLTVRRARLSNRTKARSGFSLVPHQQTVKKHHLTMTLPLFDKGCYGQYGTKIHPL
jgi:hypothetical protein